MKPAAAAATTRSSAGSRRPSSLPPPAEKPTCPIKEESQGREKSAPDFIGAKMEPAVPSDSPRASVAGAVSQGSQRPVVAAGTR